MAVSLKSIFTNSENHPKLTLFAAILLRLAFGLVNDDANDNHWEFAYLINITPQFPAFNDCHECFQPPVFYWIIAKIGKLINYNSLEQMWILMQSFSLIAGIFLCFIIYKWHNLINIPDKYKNISLAFWLFNSSLLGLNCCATNDTLLIALASGSILYFQYYITTDNSFHLVMSVFLAVLAPIIKGSGLAIVPLVVWILIIYSYRHVFNIRKIFLALSVLVASVFFIDWAGGYARKRHMYGNSFLINCEMPVKPKWSNDKVDMGMRYGIKDIKRGYFSFPYTSLIDTPYNINDGDIYPKHRTNFWTQMYGQFFSVQFLSHPHSWNHYHPDYYNITRVVFIIGLLLLFVFIVGVFFTLRYGLGHFKAIFFKPDIYSISFVAFLLLLILNIAYSYNYRDFSFIKIAYFFPAVLGFIGIYSKGLQYIFNIRYLKTAVLYVMYAIIIYYLYDYFMLFKKVME